MERPTTASSRPKTSSGRAPSARARPPPGPAAGMNGSVATGIQRPPSRMTMSRQGPPPAAPPPRQMVPPGSSMGQRPGSQSRVPTAQMGGRPTTGMARPPSSAIRPLTQQGIRAPTRLGTAGNRQVFDKSYFIGVLRTKINSLNVEIARMREKKEKCEKDRNELHAYETRAQTQALEIRDLQGKLMDLNVILDRMHMNGDMSDIELDAVRTKEKADELQGEVDDMFRVRREKEEELQQLQAEIEEQKKLNEAVAGTMDSSTKERFEDLKSESAILRDKVLEMEHEIEEMDQNIAKYQMELDSNPLKKKAVALQDTLDELNKKEADLLAEKENLDTPEQKKEKMADLMRQLNQDISVIEKQCEEVREHIHQASEELHEYESQGESRHIKHHTHYMELLEKDHKIEELLQTYPKQMPLLQQELEEYSDAVVMNLRRISANIKKVNLGGQVTDMDERGLNLNSGNVDELKGLHVRLQDELISLEDMEMALNQEVDDLETENQRMDTEIAEIERELRKDDDEVRRDLEEKKQQLEMDVPAAENEAIQLQKNINSLRSELESDPAYAKIKKSNDRQKLVEARIEKKRQELDSRQQETDFESLKNEALGHQQEWNRILLENTRYQ